MRRRRGVTFNSNERAIVLGSRLPDSYLAVEPEPVVREPLAEADSAILVQRCCPGCNQLKPFNTVKGYFHAHTKAGSLSVCYGHR